MFFCQASCELPTTLRSLHEFLNSNDSENGSHTDWIDEWFGNVVNLFDNVTTFVIELKNFKLFAPISSNSNLLVQGLRAKGLQSLIYSYTKALKIFWSKFIHEVFSAVSTWLLYVRSVLKQIYSFVC